MVTCFGIHLKRSHDVVAGGQGSTRVPREDEGRDISYRGVISILWPPPGVLGRSRWAQITRKSASSGCRIDGICCHILDLVRTESVPTSQEMSSSILDEITAVICENFSLFRKLFSTPLDVLSLFTLAAADRQVAGDIVLPLLQCMSVFD